MNPKLEGHLKEFGNPDITRALVTELLTKSSILINWSMQGLGMLRCYLNGEDLRLHIWDPEQAVDGVSTLHTHPWDMDSLVVCGRVVNQRFLERTIDPKLESDVNPRTEYMRQMIQCGEGGGLYGEPAPIYLEPQPPEIVTAGYGYSQRASEIHESRPDPGTVTIIRRRVPEDGHPDFANVYWPADQEWVSAEPRPATRTEVLKFTTQAIALMDREEA